MKRFLAAVCASVLAVSAGAQSLDQLDKLDHYNKAMNAANQLESIVASRAEATKFSCLKAFGRPTFCNCLSQNLPIALSFADYIAIVTQSKEQNGYGRLTGEVKTAYDKVPAVREMCVKQDAPSP
jgi:hypothetical protein